MWTWERNGMIIKSDKGVYVNVITIFAAGLMFFAAVEWTWLRISVCAILFAFGFMVWLECGKTLIMDEDGCTVCFLCFRKKYLWCELKTKRIERWDVSYSGIVPEKRRGVFFSKKERSDKSSLRVSSFYVWFAIDCKMRYKHHVMPEKYTVDENVFMKKMDEWQVDLEVVEEKCEKTYTYTDKYLIDNGVLTKNEKMDIKLAVNHLNEKVLQSVKFYKQYRLYRVLECLKYNREIGIVVKLPSKNSVVGTLCVVEENGDSKKIYYVEDRIYTRLEEIRTALEVYCDEKGFLNVGTEEFELLDFKVRPIDVYKDYE